MSIESVVGNNAVIKNFVAAGFKKKCPFNAKIAALVVASILTDPVCKVREYFYSFYILDETCKSTVDKVERVITLILGIAVCSLLTPLTAPLGMLIRAIVVLCESKPFVFLNRGSEGKALPADRTITLVAHNQCYMPAGYSITDGQLTPPSDKKRMKANLQELKAHDPDVICLYEVPDVCDARYLTSKLPEYPFIIPVAGPRVVGPSSMMYVASKYEIIKDSVEFTPFIKGVEVTGRAQHSEKGVLSFDIKSHGDDESFLSVISTHLQHSEIPANPEDYEKSSRSAQLTRIANLMDSKVQQGKKVVFTGDLNMDEAELDEFYQTANIDWIHRDESVRGQNTWGGDEWCARLMDKEISGAQVMDYALIAGQGIEIATTIHETGYNGPEFKKDARSDHYLLFNTITV